METSSEFRFISE